MEFETQESRPVSNVGFLESYDVCWLSSWFLTILRFPLLATCLYFMRHDAYSPLILIAVLAIVVADIFDGELLTLSKRRLYESSKVLRHVIDAVGDRIVICSVLLVAIPIYGIDASVYLLIFLRELILTAVVSKPLFNEGIIVKANIFSKIGTVCVALIGLNYIYPTVPLSILVLTFTLFGFLGIRHYLFRYEKC